MPLFKRSKKKDGSEEKEDLEAGEEPQDEDEEALAEEGKEAPADEGEGSPEPPVDETEDEELKAAEEEVLGQVDIEEELGATDEEEDEDEPSIDELLGDIEGDAQSPGVADLPKEMDSSLGDLAGEEAHVIKIAKKVVVIGDAAVGKTSLIKRYVKDEFDDRYLNTIGAKVMKKSVGVNKPDTGEIVDLKMILWDIAGQETFDTVKKAYYRGASGAIVVCDSTRRETMEHMHKWIENLFDMSDVIPMILIVNKTDLESEFQFSVDDVISEYAPYGSVVHSTSAKTGDNVDQIFHELGKLITI